MWIWIGLGVALGGGWIARGMERAAHRKYSEEQRVAVSKVVGLAQIESVLLIAMVLLTVIIDRSLPHQRDLALGLGFVSIALAGIVVQTLVQRKLRRSDAGRAAAGGLLLAAMLRFSAMLFLMAVLFLRL